MLPWFPKLVSYIPGYILDNPELNYGKLRKDESQVWN